MIVPIPIGLWIFSLICDLVYIFGGGGESWRTVAFYTMAGGIVGALIAAIPGVIDMLSLRAGLRRIALIHMAINLIVVVLFAINLGLRIGDTPIAGAVWLSVLGVVLLGVSGWLGGKMVYVHGVAVESPPRPAPETRRERMQA